MIVTRTEACDLITEMMNTDLNLEGEKLEKVIFACNSDLQVRDWLMGMPLRWSLEECIAFTQYMAIHTTKDDSIPFVTVQAMYYYELNQVEKSVLLLNYALQIDKNYSLAQLLRRVIDSGWPSESFSAMRDELDPKVVKACYGEEGALPIKENGELRYVKL
jgi:hypothetical protein